MNNNKILIYSLRHSVFGTEKGRSRWWQFICHESAEKDEHCPEDENCRTHKNWKTGNFKVWSSLDHHIFFCYLTNPCTRTNPRHYRLCSDCPMGTRPTLHSCKPLLGTHSQKEAIMVSVKFIGIYPVYGFKQGSFVHLY